VLAFDCFLGCVQLPLVPKLLRLAVYSLQIALASPFSDHTIRPQIFGRSAPSFNGSFLSWLLLIRDAQRHPITPSLQHLMQIVQAAKLVSEFCFTHLDNNRRRVGCFVLVGGVFGGSARSFEHPWLIFCSISFDWQKKH
jgi:hypothetical protein